MYRRLLRYLRPHAWRMAGTIGCNVVAAALDVFSFTLLVPFLNALFGEAQLIPSTAPTWITRLQHGMVGAFLDPADRLGSVEVMMVAIVVIVALKNVFVWLGGQLGAALQEHVTRDLRDDVFRHLQRLPLGYFQRTKTGQIISRVLADTEQTKALITELVTRTFQNLAQIVGTIVILLNYSVRLTFVALVIAPLLTLSLQPVLRRLRRGHRRLRGDYGEITSVLQEVVSGVRLVKSFRGETYEDRRFGDASGRYSSGMVRITRVAALSQPMTELIGTSVAMLILWIGAREVFAGTGTMDSATLMTFMIMVMRLLPPLKQLSQAPTTAQQSFASAERLFEVLDLPTEQQLDHGTIVVTGLRHAIEFDRVTFAYDGEPVLRDVTFTARRGEVIALVGASGAGKSTLVDLVPRFYEPTAGVIRLDGVDTRELSLASLRGLTGIVSQDTVLFNDTVRNNIAYGAGSRFTDAQVEAAARAANAHAFIGELPQGYETVLGERGTRLSGGQRQRLAIARALLTDPPILILDEATSALDTESERLVQEAIDRLLAGRTVFVIAHRLSTVVHADQILVLDRGEIVERGTHAELLARRGTYHRLHDAQLRRDAAEPVAAGGILSMRVVFYHADGEWSGASRAFAVGAMGLAAQGDTVTVVCRADSPGEQGFASLGIDVEPIAMSGSVSRDAWRLRTILKERSVEVVFLHTDHEQLVAASAMRLAERGALIRRVPPGGVGTPGKGGKLAGRMATTRLLFSTEMDRARAGAGERGFLAPLGVDVARADEMRVTSRGTLGVEPGTQLMVCVADRRAKGRITTALRTVALLAPRHPNLRLALVGSGCDDDDTHMHASALGVTSLVRFLGERDDMAAVVGAAEVGWVAADGDDGAFGCLDFMAAGVPVIAERSSLLSHYVPDGIAGVLLPPAHPNDTAATVANFLADDGQRTAMGKAGRTRVARDFGEAAMIDGFVAAASGAVDRAGRAAR